VFLASLIDRALEGRTTIAPRRASRYEIDATVTEALWGEAEIAVDLKSQQSPDRSVPLQPPRAAAQRRGPEAGTPTAARPVERPAPIEAPRSTSARDEPAPIVARLEQLAPHVEPMGQAGPVILPNPAAAPSEATTSGEAAAPAIREVHTHERVEVRYEPREIERRLVTLTREHLERVHSVETTSQAPSTPRTHQAAAPPLADEPTRPGAVQPSLPPAPPSRRGALPNAAPAEPAARTVVQVSIGRVEVRSTAPPSAARTGPRPREPRVGLDDYLRRREQA